MNNTCHSCATEIADQKVICHGFCNAEFHPHCCGISSSTLDEVAKNKQLFWLCKSCSTLMVDIRLRRTVRSAYESGQEVVLNKHNEIVESLKSEILNELRNELRLNFTALINSNSLTPRTSKPVDSANVSVRRRIFGRPVATKPPQQPLLCGSSESVSPSLGNFAAPPPRQKFWLYLSRISREVTVEQVRGLATQRLGTDELEVIRLVANGKDVSSMSFISYKIGMNEELKNKALSSSTWPKGIVFREFKDTRRATNFWKPPQTLNSPQPGDGHSRSHLSTPEDGAMED